MKCVILAAGYATRLYPLTQNYPKPLLKIGESTIIDRLIDDLYDCIDEFIVVTNHKFYSIFFEWAKNKTKVTIIDDGTVSNDNRLGAVNDIWLAVKKQKEDFLIMAGDNVLDFSLKNFLEFAKDKNSSCVMCHRENDLLKKKKTAIIEFDNEQKIISFEEKPEIPRGDYAVPPFYFYKWEDIRQIPEAIKMGCNTDAPGSFVEWLNNKTNIYAYIMSGKRYDVGDLAGYEKVKNIFV